MHHIFVKLSQWGLVVSQHFPAVYRPQQKHSQLLALMVGRKSNQD